MSDLISFLASIRWQDIVDVLLNSYILFRLYVLFRGTNVIRVVAGIALLWIFQRIAVTVGLIVTSWAMQGIIAGAALIIIIVFRNEIRNVLQAKNLRALLWGFNQHLVRTPIDAIVEGVYELARSRTGALIVLPGKDALDDVVQGGVEWQGVISKDMLLSVFYNGNPVHDGAALVEGRRVTRVGCLLPLSHREDLPHSYGTRHRAAAGLAEQSDALVIVVSEERGEVVAAKNGIMTPIEDNLSLIRCLRDHLGGDRGDLPAVSQRKRLEMATAAAMCFLCMAGIWFSFARGMETLTSLEVPLEYLNRDSQMQILSTSVNTVRLYLSGSTTLLSSLHPEQVKAKLDLGNATNGVNVIRIAGNDIVVPPGVRLNRIEPSEVRVVLDTPVSKLLPIQVDWVGRMPAGLILESISLSPATATVVGPAKVLDRIATLYSRNVQLDKLEKSGQMTVRLDLEPATLKMSDGFDDVIQVRYTIRRRLESS
jgi:diadenylate cyclase